MNSFNKHGALFTRCLKIVCAVVIPTAIASGCVKHIAFSVVNNYAHRVNLYQVSMTPGYTPYSVGSLPANGAINVSLASIPDGSTYQFSVRDQHGKQIELITIPSKQLNNNTDKGKWKLILGKPKSAP